MIELLREHRSNHTDFIRTGRNMRSESENSIPLCPKRVKVRGLAQTLAMGLMKANLKSLVIDAGND